MSFQNSFEGLNNGFSDSTTEDRKLETTNSSFNSKVDKVHKGCMFERNPAHLLLCCSSQNRMLHLEIRLCANLRGRYMLKTAYFNNYSALRIQ